MAAVPAVAVYCVHSVGLPLQTPARPGCDPQNYGLLQRYDTNYVFYSTAVDTCRLSRERTDGSQRF